MSDLNELKSQISDLVEQYITQKQEDNKWKPGDTINYSGTYFTADEYVAAVESVLSGWFGLGVKGLQFERRFAPHLGKTQGVFVNSGSSANLLMVAALLSKNVWGLPKGSKILTPAAGFPTTVNPIIQLGFSPVFVDIELKTLNLDLDDVERKLKENPDTRAIMFAHVLGNPPDMYRLLELVKKYNLILLEDCCDALGSTYHQRPLGSFGSMASCSFYPAHHISTGEGGFVATESSTLNDVVRSLRDWGRACYCQGPVANKLVCGTCGQRFSEWLPELPGQIFDHKYVYSEIGFNLKPLELQAAIGLEQLRKIPEISDRRKRNFNRLLAIYEMYDDKFILPEPTPNSDPSWFAFPLTIKENAGFTRAEFCQHLENNKIQTRPYFAGNLLLQPGYKHVGYPGNPVELFPKSTYATTETFFHGTSPVITEEQLAYIEDKVDDFFISR